MTTSLVLDGGQDPPRKGKCFSDPLKSMGGLHCHLCWRAHSIANNDMKRRDHSICWVESLLANTTLNCLWHENPAPAMQPFLKILQPIVYQSCPMPVLIFDLDQTCHFQPTYTHDTIPADHSDNQLSLCWIFVRPETQHRIAYWTSFRLGTDNSPFTLALQSLYLALSFQMRKQTPATAVSVMQTDIKVPSQLCKYFMTISTIQQCSSTASSKCWKPHIQNMIDVYQQNHTS